MKKILMLLILCITFVQLNAQEESIDEMFIDLIDTPANFNITLTVTPETPTYWDANINTSEHPLSNDYEVGSVQLDQTDDKYGID